MPRFPVVSGRQAVDALLRLGFEHLRTSGSHAIVRRGARGCVVPLHRELKQGTLAGILRQAGVEANDFIAML